MSRTDQVSAPTRYDTNHKPAAIKQSFPPPLTHLQQLNANGNKVLKYKHNHNERLKPLPYVSGQWGL